jgi:hypothetical protein
MPSMRRLGTEKGARPSAEKEKPLQNGGYADERT